MVAWIDSRRGMKVGIPRWAGAHGAPYGHAYGWVDEVCRVVMLAAAG
jgi:hypothetical protein